MKKILKDMLPAIIIAFATSFMLYIYEPIITYAGNINDFWFDLKLMFPNILLYFVLVFIILMAIYAIIYLLSCKLNKDIIFKTILAISFVLFTYFYIQGVFLVGNLPFLDGTTIEWGSYTSDTLISVCVIVTLTITQIIVIKKLNIEKTINLNKYIIIVIFLMISVSVITSFTNPAIFREKIVATATNRNINSASTNKNYYIFLVDAVDSYAFSKIVEENEKYESTFEDFTYYPDTVSGYTFTRDSIPFIFSGLWNENQTDFNEYSTKAYNSSKFINELKNRKYNMNFYENQITWSDRNASSFSNIDIYNDRVDNIKFFKELTKYILFKYLPYPLKQYSHIETADFDLCRVDKEESYFEWKNNIAYENIKNNGLEKIEENYFQFMHIEGGHAPFDYDENVNIISTDEGTYEKKLAATLNIIDSFIERLKEYDVYDNSVVIVMADHGFWNGKNARQNPILYIKGIDEHHKMETSDTPVSYEDLCNAFIELLNDKKANELFKNVDPNRIRRFLDNPFDGEDVMTEYEQRGKAWDPSAMFETGRKFNR